MNDNGRLRDEGEGDVGAGGFGELSGGEEELGGKKDEGQKGTGTNPWWKILDNAGDHPDGYVAEVSLLSVLLFLPFSLRSSLSRG